MEPVTNKEFFKFLFGDLTGYLCIVTINRNSSSKKKDVKQQFFNYPQEIDNALQFIDKHYETVDLYFAPFLMTQERRRKEDILETPIAWADGDDCPIEVLKLQPSAVVRSSKAKGQDKYHFYWKFDEVELSDVGENISKRIAYAHADEGMDKGGWDLTQLLRVPGTLNHKYVPPQKVSRAVIDKEAIYSTKDFDVYPEVEESLEFIPIEELELPNETAKEIISKYKNDLNPRALELYVEVPTHDWSRALWELELTLLESGMTPEETFVVASDAACNKYRREKRSERNLWKEIQKAKIVVEERSEAPPVPEDSVTAGKVEPPRLLSDDERDIAKSDTTFVEEYSNWAKGLGDAAPQYHPAGAFTILSCLMSGTVKLPTSFGTVIPNLWFMILADTTLTRKSTAMDNAMDLLLEVDSDLLLATDGSIEGLMTAIATRSGKPSLFLRDEITGLIEAISKKEYLAGMMETLTKLYDGKTMKRILRRETIDVRDPRLIFFSGGIRNKMMELLDHRHVNTGFLPRFIFITAESDITRLKPVGPPTDVNLSVRDELLDKMQAMYAKYTAPTSNTTATSSSVTFPRQWPVELTSDAWARYNLLEHKMLDFAIKSHDPTIMTPMMDRLAKSGLKASVLIAASRMPEDNVVVDETDLVHAFYYIEQWMKHTLYIISNLGTSHDERKLQKILAEIQSNAGIQRSTLMQRNYLTAREADNLFATLEQRGAIRRDKRGARTERLYPAGQ